MKYFLVPLIFIYTITCCSQNTFNLDFELKDKNDSLPKNWFKLGAKEYTVSTDSLTCFSGNHSGVVNAPENGSSFGAIAYKIPNGYQGKIIRLEGYIKTENVADGYAGLLLRLDRGDNVVGFDNMNSKGITGTNDWKKYEITLPFKEADIIYVAGLLVGEGKAWFDDFKVSVDGKNIEELKFKERKKSKAELDKEFDKGSNFSITHLDKEKIENLYKLGKTWGLLKYTNPNVGSGEEYNWDYELFRALPMIKEKPFGEKLSTWETSYGGVEDKLSKNNYYIDFVRGIKNPDFKNENVYDSMDFSDDGYRLLALFRYWNIIEYFFPYKHLIEKDWNQVLKEYIPKIINADDELSYKLTLLELIGEVQDSHANIWQKDKTLDKFFGNKIAPIKINFIENKAVVVEFYGELPENSKLKIGDELQSIDGKSVSEYIEEKGKYFPASNYPAKLRDIARKLLRSNQDEICLEFSNGTQIFSEDIATLPLGEIDFYTENIPSHKNLANDIGYIYPASLEKGEIEDIMKTLMNKKGIVVDLRCYPSDFIVFSMGKYLMPKPTPFVKFKTATQKEIGEYEFSKAKKVGKRNKNHYKGKIAILVNETTQSNAEYTTMAFQVAPKAKVFGSQTAGADGNVSRFYLPGNIHTMISGIGVYYPDGVETQQIGVKIDVPVKPTIKGIKAGKDEVLEKALKYIEE